MHLFTGEERKKYMDLCNKMTSRQECLDYKSLADKMIDYLQIHTWDEIESLKEGEKKTQMKIDFGIIFNNHQHDDRNHIGRVNIVSLQVIILFTVNDPKYTDDFNKYDFVDSYDNYTPNVVRTFQELMKIKWRKYDAVKIFLEGSDCGNICVLYSIRRGEPYFEDNTIPTSEQTIYLITIIKYFTLDEMNSAFLKNNILCGVSYKSLFADGRWMNPYMFLDHDIIHGQNYDALCFDRVRVERMELIKFYEYCRTNYTGDKQKWYSIKVMMFLLIHEGLCNFFLEQGFQEMEPEEFIQTYFHNGMLKMKRFEDANDLGEMIPKEYREKVVDFFEIAIPNYLTALKSWHESLSEPSGGSRYKRKYRRTKKVSKRKTNKKKSRRK